MKKQYLTGLLLFAVCGMLLAGCGKTTAASATDVEETTQVTEENTLETSESETESTEDVSEEETVTTTEEVQEKQPTLEEKETEQLPEYTCTSFEQSKTMYASNAVNVRKGPATDFEVVSHLAFAQEIAVTGQADTGWYQLMVDGQEAYVSDKYLTEQKPEAQPAKAKTSKASGSIIMVGDSRFVQMKAAVDGGGVGWVCENSKGYTWLNETAMAKIDAAVGNGSRIIINLGVNDPGNVKNYATLINAKAAEWSGKGAVVYYVSVNPVWENPYTTEEQVTTFNSTMPSLLSPGIGWIDTHSWLVNNGYKLVDGLHYDNDTYVNIFNLIMGSI